MGEKMDDMLNKLKVQKKFIRKLSSWSEVLRFHGETLNSYQS